MMGIDTAAAVPSSSSSSVPPATSINSRVLLSSADTATNSAAQFYVPKSESELDSGTLWNQGLMDIT